MENRHSFTEVQNLLARIFRAEGFSPEHAELLATNCATAEADGSVSHGLFRMRHYADTIKSGYADPAAEPIVEDVAPSVLRVDAAGGFALMAIEKARSQLCKKANSNGIAVLLVRNSHHLGALYLDIEPFLRLGFVALALVNSEAVVAPPGASRAIYGTNPVAFGAPRHSDGPVFWDQSSSTTAFGEVQMAAREGRTLPDGTGVDAKGNLTGSPQAILDGGALLTFGGHKGASIALMVEIMCAALGGADFGYEVSCKDHPGAMTSRTGETIILIDPGAGASNLRPFAKRLDELTDALKAAGQARVPGERRLHLRGNAMTSGIAIDDRLWRELTDMAQKT
ncbi:Malate/L-lactate dehydrogenase [Mesorhizobium sp. SOD10]|nr:Malate/L-lactate dehydrogenase [Mesorhizobium sp. SOD10]